MFGSLFSKKNVTSPTTEKTEAEAVTAKDAEVPPVSETAPKIDEPIDTKPLDAAAVTAPALTTGDATTEEATKEPATTPAGETTATTPKAEKKSNFLSGFIKKVEGKKDEGKEDKPVETAATNAAAPTTTETTGTVTETPATKDERPQEKRRTSLFGGLGTLKKKDKKEETTEPSEEVNGTETKREKSPLPGKLGGLFRRPSKAAKSDSPKETTATEPTTETTPAAETTPATEEVKPATDSKIVGDVVPEDMHASTADKIATAPEVKASA